MYRLIHGDCTDVMRSLLTDDVKVDLIITDPPYLMNYKTGHRKDKSHDFCSEIMNDNNPELISEFIRLSYDLLKDGSALYMFCNANHIDFFKREVEKYFKLKNILIWVKNNWSAGDLKGAYAKQTEFIIYAVKGRHILNGRRDTDVLYYNRVVGNNQVHQNQKPVDLLEYLISKSSNEGDLVFDGFAGSGSTGVACNNLNRDFIGVELDSKYLDIAYSRLDSIQAKL